MNHKSTDWEAIHERDEEHSVAPFLQQPPGEDVPGHEFQDRSLELAGSDLLLGC